MTTQRVALSWLLSAALVVAVAPSRLTAQQKRRPYRLQSVDLKQRVIWGAECRQGEGQGLAFGGQDQDADDGRPHTRILVKGAWNAIHTELRGKNPLQKLHDKARALRNEAKTVRARARFIYFQGLPATEQIALVRRDVQKPLTKLSDSLDRLIPLLRSGNGDEYAEGQIRFARRHVKQARESLPTLADGVAPEPLKRLHKAQIHLALAAEAFDAEPPARALRCGQPRTKGDDTASANGIAYDAKTKLYVIFGGDHLDYLTNDTWVFDAAKRRWFQRHPRAAPQPRANHRLEANGDGKIRLKGGYTYASNTDYVGGQYVDLADGEWTYDVEKNEWSGGKLVASDTRVYRTGPFHPDFYLQGEKPDAAKFQARLTKLPSNEWVATNPPYRPRLNRDWGAARIDSDRDMMLRWSGGHSAHGGTDVPHFHFATNRWELPFPVEFPLDSASSVL